MCVRQAKKFRPFVIFKEMISLALILLTLESPALGGFEVTRLPSLCQKIGDCCSRELLGDDGGGSGGLVSFLYTGEAGWGNCGRGPTCLV